LASALGVPNVLMMTGDHPRHCDHAERGRGKQFGLQRDPVPVPAGQLHDRLDAGGQSRQAPGQAGQPDCGALIVGDVDGVNPIPQQRCLARDGRCVRAARRADLGRDGELACR